MNIGEKLIKLRKEKNISQEKLSNTLGITRQTLSNWESNITSPNLEQTKKIARLFNVSIDELVDNNIILNKLNNTEYLMIKQTKFTKIILLTIYTLLIGLLLFYSFKMFTKKDFTSKYSTDFKCTLKGNTTSFSVTYSGKHIGCVEYNGEPLENCDYQDQEETYYLIASNPEGQEQLKIGTSISEMFKSLEYVKEYFLNHGAICIDNKD